MVGGGRYAGIDKRVGNLDSTFARPNIHYTRPFHRLKHLQELDKLAVGMAHEKTDIVAREA